MDDRLLKLRDLEAVVLASIQGAPEDKRAPLVAQYRALLAEIESLSKATEKAGDPVDEIAARRSARGGSTARSRRAGSGSR